MSGKPLLYHFFWQDRGGRVKWLLEELGVEYEVKYLSYKDKEYSSPEYLNINPNGVCPTLVDGDSILFESGAICCFLADKHIDKNLAPSFGSPSRGEYYKWMFYAAVTLDGIMAQALKLMRLPEGERRTKFQPILEEFSPMKEHIKSALERSEYLVDNRFTAADIMVADVLRWLESLGFLVPSEDQVLLGYLERLAKRPASIRYREKSLSLTSMNL